MSDSAKDQSLDPSSISPSVEAAIQALSFGIAEQISRVRCDSSAPATTRPDLINALIIAVRSECAHEVERLKDMVAGYRATNDRLRLSWREDTAEAKQATKLATDTLELVRADRDAQWARAESAEAQLAAREGQKTEIEP